MISLMFHVEFFKFKTPNWVGGGGGGRVGGGNYDFMYEVQRQGSTLEFMGSLNNYHLP